MAPEILQLANSEVATSGYDFKVDIWSLAITFLEMAEGNPPYHTDHSIKAIFKICHQPPPTLANPSQWSPEFNSFLSRCLIKISSQRATTEELLRHPFILNNPEDQKIRLALVTEIQSIRSRKNEKTSDDRDNSPEQSDEEVEEDSMENLKKRMGDEDELQLLCNLDNRSTAISSFQMSSTSNNEDQTPAPVMNMPRRRSVNVHSVFALPPQFIEESVSQTHSLRLEVAIDNLKSQKFVLYCSSNASVEDFRELLFKCLGNYPRYSHLSNPIV